MIEQTSDEQILEAKEKNKRREELVLAESLYLANEASGKYIQLKDTAGVFADCLEKARIIEKMSTCYLFNGEIHD